MVAAALHGHGQLIGTAERRDKQRDQDRHQCLDALGEGAAVQHGTAGLLGVHDLFGFLNQSRDKPQGNRHHHGQLMHRKVQLSQRAQQALDGIGQHNGAGRVGQKAGACNEGADAHSQQNGVLDALGIDVQHPEMHQRLPLPCDEEKVQHGGEEDYGHDGLQAFQNHPAGDAGDAVKQRQKADRERQPQRVRCDKQHNDVGDGGNQL